jgi:hypothetical protein
LGLGPQTGDRLREGRLRYPCDASDPDNFTASDGERDVSQRAPDMKALNDEPGGPRRVGGRGRRARLIAHHQARDRLAIEPLDWTHEHHLATAQHRHLLRAFQNLAHSMRDETDSDARPR